VRKKWLDGKNNQPRTKQHSSPQKNVNTIPTVTAVDEEEKVEVAMDGVVVVAGVAAEEAVVAIIIIAAAALIARDPAITTMMTAIYVEKADIE